MVVFIFICAIMIMLALWLILPPLWRAARDAQIEDARAANVLVYQDQLRELQADLKTGLLTQAQYDQDKEEIERRLLEDVGVEKQSASPKVATRRLGYAVAIFIPIAAIIFYIFVGSPKLIDAPANSPSTLQRR